MLPPLPPALETRRAALLRLAAMLGALVGAFGGVLPRHRRAWLRGLLRPAEAAARRLVVIAAAQLSVEAAPVRPAPERAKMRARRAVSFRMIEPRLGPLAPEPVGLSIAPGDPDAPVPAAALGARAQALGAVLDGLPKVARRYALRLARAADAPPGPRRCGAMRPGLPPGLRRSRRHPVQEILATFHATALVAGDIRWDPG